ncbi:allergen [Cryptococcus wingfieldii CBS 7118]|uniref:Allergen n=1 Tax=Cryptococcus wingfieldii CBS 7118 TaxID=1295528 RepID=A0A1E3IRX0_9TREE|nr:allergen [Cryptococcus wingfieldii CBS 7118]ODN91357.1 allergen [Cryptococcus wingfieldii CBS 7118]
MSNVTQGVKEFFSGSTKPETTEVCTESAPEVVQEHVRPQEHVKTADAIDRERHVHHHQHRVQPVADSQTLPEKHIHSTAPIVHTEHTEDMLPEHQQTLQQQRGLHQSQKTEGGVERSGEHVGVAVNEHAHHHIHETIQPVIQRETVAPTVVHKTNAVHETVKEAPIVHEVTTLPTVSAAEYAQTREEPGQGVCRTYEGGPAVAGSGAGAAGAGTHGLGKTGTGIGHSSQSGTTGTTGTGIGHSSHSGTTGTGIGHSSHSPHSSSTTPGLNTTSGTTGTTGTGTGKSHSKTEAAAAGVAAHEAKKAL